MRPSGWRSEVSDCRGRVLRLPWGQMRSLLASFCLLAVLCARAPAADLSFTRVWLQWRKADSFQSLYEYRTARLVPRRQRRVERAVGAEARPLGHFGARFLVLGFQKAPVPLQLENRLLQVPDGSLQALYEMKLPEDVSHEIHWRFR